jgi:peptide/nickel transport system permease protein
MEGTVVLDQAPHSDGGVLAPLRRLSQSEAITLLIEDKAALLGLVFVCATITAAVAAPVLGLSDPARSDLNAQLLSPFSAGHPLGTDELGRDTLSRLVYGARPALIEGVLPVLLAALIGSAIGGVVGFLGGRVDSVSMRLVEVVLAIPPVMMGIAVAATLGPGLNNVLIAMTLVLIPPMTRVARGAVLTVRENAFVSASRSLGARESSLFLRHVMPNAASQVIAYAFSLVGIMIVFAAGLSFIGLGVQPPTADWGRMVNDGRLLLSNAPWVATFPGLAIFAVGLSFGFIGDWVEKAVERR